MALVPGKPQGLHQELSQVFIDHLGPLRHAARKIVGTVELAEEVAQDAYLKLMDAEVGARIEQPLAYCFRIVRNLALDRRRRLSFESRLFTVDDEEVLADRSAGTTPEQCAMSRQHLLLIDKVLAALPERTRQVFELHRIGGLTQRDIGARLGVSAALVNAMVREAMDALRQGMGLVAAG